jgi:exosortase
MEPAAKNLEPGTLLTNRRVAALYPAVGFVLLCVTPIAFVWGLTRDFLALAFQNDTFAYIPLIPVVSLYLIYIERKSIFSMISYDWKTGCAFIVPGAMCLVLARLNFWQLGSANQISLVMFAFLIIWMGAFALFFGNHSFHAASFPLLFLLFMVPIPEPLLSQAVLMLQHGSAKAAESIFQLFDVPFFRQGLDFALPGVTIRVAEECSGIRSSLALLITTVLASHFFLRSSWRRLLLCIFVIPIVILKNGLRIATLSTLAIYVNPGFLHGNLHRRGGIVFFLIALIPMALLLVLLQKSENPRSAAAKNA